MSTLHRKLARDLWRNRTQVLAIAAVISAGVATVVLASGTQYSLEETRAAYYERYRFADVFARCRRAPERLVQRLVEMPEIERVQTRIVEDVLIDLENLAEPARGQILSVPDGEAAALNHLYLVVGRDLRAGAADEILLGQAFAEANDFHPGDRLAVNVNGKRRRLRIVGIALSPEFVYAIGPGEIVPDNRRFGVLWMNRSALEAAYDLDGAFNDLSVGLAAGANEDDAIAHVDDVLEPFGGTGAFGRRDHVSDSFLRGEFDQLSALSRIVPPIFLGVAAFLLSIVVQRLIATQREQIGLLKAFGYSNWTVGWHFLQFALVVTAVGITLGWIAGAWLGRGLTDLYAEHFRFPFLYYLVSPKVFAVAAGASAVAAVAGATFAVHRAVRITPAVAMAPPAPTQYRASAIERLRVFSRLRPHDRMIVRHVARWPVRSLLTAVGVAFSVALLVSSFFFLDAIDEMLDAFFFRSRRHDVAVHFTAEREQAVRHALEHLPGVLYAELYRSVPVRFRHGPRTRLSTITGVEPGARLTRLETGSGEPVGIPSTGIVFTQGLAERLAIGAGESVQVEVLEGARPHADLRVERVVEEYVGTAAYMDREALSRLMKEAPSASGAQLSVDAREEGSLFRRLKETPQAAGVTVRRAALATFRRMIDETMGSMIFTYVVFASIIAIGVIYNNARIALSERAREFGSLRVLGFHHREVAYILVGELTLLTVVAIPVGWVLGYVLSAQMVSMFDTHVFRIPLVIRRASYGYASLIVLAAAAGAAWLVARRIARLDLVQVLKTRE